MEIVAELSYNHFGNIEYAFKMIELAKNAGATAVKFEIRNSKNYFKHNAKIEKKKSKYEFTDKDIEKFADCCKKYKIDWFASIHDLHSLQRICSFNPKYIKVASREVRCFEFLKAIKNINRKKFPILVSTGGLSFFEIKKIYTLLKEEDLTIIHTSCLYPCPIENLNMNRIKLMKEKFAARIGYSGHEQGYEASLYAVSVGADYLERHFSLNTDKVAKGMKSFRDDLCTLTPEQFADMAVMVKIIYELRNRKPNLTANKKELQRVNIYGKPAWNGTDIYLKPVLRK